MKLIMALAVSTMILSSTFMQSALASRRTGNEYSVMGENETAVYYKFNLFDTDESGREINAVDADPENPDPKIRLFKRAITNYASVSTDFNYILIYKVENLLQSDNRDHYNSDGFPILYTSANEFGDDLRERSVNPFARAITLFEVGDLLAELVEFRSKEYIRYSIFEEYTPDAIPFSNFILDPTSGGKTFTSEREGALPSGFNQVRAINDLSYILNNNLLDYVNNLPFNDEDQRELFRVSRDVGWDERCFEYDDYDGEYYYSGGSDECSDIRKQGHFIIKQGVIKPQVVPENNNSTVSLFALGTFSIYLLLKRKFNCIKLL
jgi:hypothetical protein